jgi:hypothetical protein
MEVSWSVARPTLGTLLYQSLAKYAYTLGSHIMSARDGNTRCSAFVKWEDFYKTTAPEFKRRIPDCINEDILDFCEEEGSEDKYISTLFAYHLPADELFTESLVDISSAPDGDKLRSLIILSGSIFSNSYDLECNKWINENYPLMISTQETKRN